MGDTDSDMDLSNAEQQSPDPGTATSTLSPAGTVAAAALAPAKPVVRWGTMELRELVGHGGFGEVYRAFDPQLDREVALKLLFPREGGRALDETLEREGRLLARLRHPNIVSVYGLARQEGRVGLWMEFLVGRTLDQIVATQGRFGEREAAATACEVCRATAAAHAAGLVHRDIKAQNVIREEGGRVVLTDFGLGEYYQSSGIGAFPESKLAGTPAYMAPELFTGTPANVRTDIYALGVLLFYLVTGQFPVTGRTLSDYMQAHRERRRRLLADVRPDLSDQFIRIVDRAVAPDPDRRFESAGQLQAQLADFQAGAGPAVTPPPAAVPAASSASRRTLLFGATGAGVSAVAGGWWLAFQREPAAPTVAANSIVVLPFENITKQPAEDVLADSITEELINTLTKSELRVVARTSAFRLRGTTEEPRQIGKRLGVETLLTGTVRRMGDRIRVSAQLVNAGSGLQIWSDTYEQQASEALSIEGEISRRVATSLRRNLLRSASAGPASAQRSGNWEAHNAYTQGRYHATRRTMQSLKTAIGFYESAIQLDPGNALAHAGLADALAYMGVLRRPTPEIMTRMKQEARRALELDAKLAEPETTLGMISHLYDWDAVGAEAHFLRALERNSGSVEARRHYAGLLMNVLRISESRAELDLALAFDPLSPLLRLSRALVEYLIGSYRDCEERLNKLLESDPAVPHAYQVLGLVHLDEGRRPASIQAFRRSVELAGGNLSFRAYLGFILGMCGQPSEARTILQEVLAGSQSGTVDPLDAATVYAGLGEHRAALDWLNKAWEIRSPNLVQLLLRPTWRELWSEPGFADLVSRIPLFQNVDWSRRRSKPA